MRTFLITVGSTVVALVIAITASSLMLKAANANFKEELQNQRIESQVEIEAQRQALIKIAHEISIPPNNDKLFTITTQGIAVAEYEFKGSDSVGVTPEAAFTVDVGAANRTDAWTQQTTFHNIDSTDNLCVKPITWASAGGATCQLKCAASSVSCTGASGNDGKYLQPGQEVTRDWDGTSCLCVVGSAAGVSYQTERILR